VDIARSAGLPAVYTSASTSANVYMPGDYGDYRTNWSARVLFSMPLFTGYAATYELQRTQREAEVAGALVQSLEQQVILQVWTSYYALETATRRLQTSRDLLESATQSERVAFGRYREGVGTILDLLVAQAALANARAQEIQSRTDWFVTLARLARDTGAATPLADTVTIQQRPNP
jgi:outer membrane protein TolC